VYRTEDNISRRHRNKCVLFQRDSLSTLTFCISFIPLTVELKSLKQGIKSAQKRQKYQSYFKRTIDNDSKTEEGLQKELQILKNFSNVNNMDFGLDKCPNIILKKGYLCHSQNMILEFYRQI
jgi:hypothetical protein